MQPYISPDTSDQAISELKYFEKFNILFVNYYKSWEAEASKSKAVASSGDMLP